MCRYDNGGSFSFCNGVVSSSEEEATKGEDSLSVENSRTRSYSLLGCVACCLLRHCLMYGLSFVFANNGELIALLDNRVNGGVLCMLAVGEGRHFFPGRTRETANQINKVQNQQKPQRVQQEV